MSLSTDQVIARVRHLKLRAAPRDVRAGNVLQVRTGNISSVFPDFFPEGIDASVVANFVDVVARDISETMAPLPAVNCSAVNQSSDKSREFADTRTQIASNYFNHSDLGVHMYQGADWYITYGFLPFIVELDMEAKLPRIRLEDPRWSYPEFDRYGRTVAFAKRYLMSIGELVAAYPEWELNLLGVKRYEQDLNAMLEVIRYYDKDQSMVYVPERSNLVLSVANNPIGKMMVIVAKRPSIDNEMRGQFDDVLGIQMLRNRFALLAMEAAEKAIQAPIVLPMDVQEFTYGSDAVIRTGTPQGVHRVPLDLPQSALQEGQLLNQELRVGTRYPESRTGNINASVVTGQGVQALMGAFDSQIKSGQAIFASILRDVVKICFEVDEKAFDEKKTIRGTDAGSPYEVDYLPSKDIKGDYSVDVRYGMLAGLNPAQGLLFMLQAMGGDLVSKDRAMRELPFDINVTREQEKIEVEKMRSGLLASVEALVQSIPQVTAQGGDPTKVVLQIASAIKDRLSGKSLEDSLLVALAPPPPPPPAAEAPVGEPPVQGQPSPAPDAGSPTGAPPMGGPPGAVPGAPPPPDLMTMLTSASTGGRLNGSVKTSKQIK